MSSTTAFIDSSAIEFAAALLVAGGIMCLSIAAGVREHLKKKRKKQEKQYYKATHVKTVTLTDLMMFGTIEAEYDDQTGILTAEQAALPKFGNQAPNRIVVEGYQDGDQETILRLLGRAYDKKDEILDKMAEEVRKEMMFDEPDNLPELAEIREQIAVTDFQFTSGAELMTMLINAGTEIGTEAFSLTALYYSSPVHWEYEAVKMSGSV